ncbi:MULTISPECIES: DUF6898 family protein [Magnetospirillum]|uniref:DUF6898 domain-containing protein n=1 Tax=Magnetospirillum moscoviense TaxID=1437059 RepID=A0A178MRP3_9PROT|nr:MULTISPECIES: hypothetical protein [Magnetospirillum]MBF0323790.1 hypothetical protein [Alphaproteobacteria bacterium]OAN50614.1 hypothetical protein A6A05_12085 [Magnetospirillum moscoviense]CAA7613274.1 conserved hypothetical protein [Magnetospirillum sp. LM-5]
MTTSREVLFEFRRVGNAVKVSAVDVETAVEVSIVGDARSTQAQLKAVALRKLQYVLEKQKQ